VQQTLSSLRVEKWKKGSVRYEATEDIDAILHDMQTNLPPLLKEADTAPGELSKALPVARHIDALYDVLLRVVEAARFVAPEEQATQARQALASLEHARLAFDDRLQQQAITQERQIGELDQTVQKESARKCPVPNAFPAAQESPAAQKKPLRKKPVAATAKPGAQGSAGTQGKTGTQGNAGTQTKPGTQGKTGTQSTPAAKSAPSKSAAPKTTTAPKPGTPAQKTPPS
jgi:hypothetical protein